MLAMLAEDGYRPDIAVLDICMDDMDGISLAKEINRLAPACRVIFLSSYAGYLMDAYEDEHIYYVLKSDEAARLPVALRKALGARPKTIQMQFLLEAVMLSLLGGIIGILLGNLLSLLFAAWLQVDFELSTGAILLAFLFSATVGIIFGWAPARKASRLNPIDALRSM